MLSNPLLALSAGSNKSRSMLRGKFFQRQQIADGILVPGACQTPKRGNSSRIGMQRRNPIKVGLQL